MLNTNVKLEVELGTVDMSIADIESLSKGSIIDLNILTDSMSTVKVNGTKIGSGEITVLGKNMAVRIKEISNG